MQVVHAANVALDIHKHYCVVAAVNREGQVVLQPVRVEHADLEGWLKKNLQTSDHVVIESTTNAWHVYDLLEPLTERVLVANPIVSSQKLGERHSLHDQPRLSSRARLVTKRDMGGICFVSATRSRR